MDQLASLFDLDLEKLDITSDGMNLSRSIEITSQVLELSLEDVGHDDAGPYENVMKAFSLVAIMYRRQHAELICFYDIVAS